MKQRNLVIPSLALFFLSFVITSAEAQDTWTQLSPSASPVGLFDYGLVNNSTNNTVILFGGADESNVRQNGTWSWNGTTWTQLSPSASPSARSEFGMAYDAGNQEVVIFGGRTSNFPNNQT